MSELDSLRLDKWLWAARFYKTRKLANDAVLGGKVHLNGQRTKPSKEIKVGAQLKIHIEPYTWEITVLSLLAQRRPAEEARQLYLESAESHAKRQAEVAAQRELKSLFPYQPSHKPNKKERRLIHRFIQEQS